MFDSMPTVQCWREYLWLIPVYALESVIIWIVFGVLIPLVLRRAGRSQSEADAWLFPEMFIPLYNHVRRFIGWCGWYHGCIFVNIYFGIAPLVVAAETMTTIYACAAVFECLRRRENFTAYIRVWRSVRSRERSV